MSSDKETLSRTDDGSEWIDLKTLMAVRNLQWRAQKVVDGFQTGLHRSPKHGFSVEFSEYRPYSIGDDPKTIDWKLYARSDRYYRKRFEDETNRRCYLVIDQSKSMQYGSIDYTKYEYARTLIATLALFLLRQRDAVGAVAFDQQVTDWLTARFRTGQFQRILSMLSKPCGGLSTNLTAPLAQIADLVKHRSLVVIVSDFLVDPGALKAPLAFLRARKHEVVLLRVLDPLEIDFRHGKPVLVRDMESGNERFVDPVVLAETYHRKFQSHRSELSELLAPLGIPMVDFRTTDPMELVLSSFLSMREGVGAS
ncbi:MAG: DUF58 domain-containing protein [Pirellula sp.]